jgi:hypothetical protein
MCVRRKEEKIIIKIDTKRHYLKKCFFTNSTLVLQKSCGRYHALQQRGQVLTGQLTSTGLYNFRIPSENGLMIDTATIRLEGTLQLMKVQTDGTEVKMTALDNALLVNMFPAALFRSIEVSLNRRQLPIQS